MTDDGSQLLAEERASLRPWWIATFVFIAIFGALLAVDLRDTTFCKGDELRIVPVPPAWASFTALPGLGGYDITGEEVSCIGHGIQCGLIDTELHDPKVCPREGVTLDAYFDGDIYQSTGDIRLYESGGTFVATSHSSMTRADPEKPVVAFVRVPHDARLVFRHAHPKLRAEVFAWVLLLLVAGVSASMRFQRAERHDAAGVFARVTALGGVLAVIGACVDVFLQWASSIRID